jgi:hypothetical protein
MQYFTPVHGDGQICLGISDFTVVCHPVLHGKGAPAQRPRTALHAQPLCLLGRMPCLRAFLLALLPAHLSASLSSRVPRSPRIHPVCMLPALVHLLAPFGMPSDGCAAVRSGGGGRSLSVTVLLPSLCACIGVDLLCMWRRPPPIASKQRSPSFSIPRHAVGLHRGPCSLTHLPAHSASACPMPQECGEGTLEALRQLASDERCVAIGEVLYVCAAL